MTYKLTKAEFDRAVMRNCAPTLLGAKASNMFTIRGVFADTCPGCDADKDACPCPPEPDAKIVSARARALDLAGQLDAELAHLGVRATVITWRPFGAIVYVWRPALLAAHLSDPRIVEDLAAHGYPEGASQDELISRMRRSWKESRMPHEVGYFLGYPFEDVDGFIRHEGRDFVYAGCWKAYADARGSFRRFERFRRCDRRCAAMRAAGASFADVAGLSHLAA